MRHTNELHNISTTFERAARSRIQEVKSIYVTRNSPYDVAILSVVGKCFSMPSLSSFFFSEDRVDLLATAVKNSTNASSRVEIYKRTVPTSRYNTTSIHATHSASKKIRYQCDFIPKISIRIEEF